jgi:xyloglucan-specific exo-beta-1,4-glucanase
MPEPLTITQQLLPTLLLLGVGLGVAHLLAIVIARSGQSHSRQMARVVRLGAIALVAVIALHQIYAVGLPSSASKVVSYSEKHWQKGTQGWANVAIGGGGYVTGVYIHPRQKDLVYIRTDIGGIYRWQPQDQRWLPLTDHFPLSQHNYYGTEALAIDPNDPSVIYMAAGKYLWEKGALFKSVNQGKTWTKLSLELPMGGNEPKRWAGERLMVNPFDSKVVLFGSRQDGLWRSADAGKTWKRVEALPAKPEKDVGILSIAFDPQKAGVVYLSAYDDGVYQSPDAGITWSKVKDSPRQVNRLAVAPNGTLYATGNVEPKVSQYRNGQWRKITPTKTQMSFNGLAIDPNNANQIMVSLGETPKTEIYRSENGGESWQKLNRRLQRTVPWWQKDQFSQPWVAAMAFDPHVPNRVWLTEWAGVWRTDNVAANPTVWTNYANGHEEVLAIDLAAPPEGPLLISGVGDVEGFYHDQGLDEFPSRKLELKDAPRGFHFTVGIDYAETKPQHMVRIGYRSHSDLRPGATSSDGGLTWKQFASFPKEMRPTQVAMSATNPAVMVVTIRRGKPLYTHDGGKTWKAVQGLPERGKEPRFVPPSLAADRVDGDTFYYYLASEGELFRSGDGGASFKEITDTLPKSEWHVLKPLPGKEGDLWLGLDQQGLYRSTNDGQSFAKVAGVERAYLLSFGKPPADRETPALYLYGKVTGQGDGIFRSLNLGKTWVKITDARNPVGNRPMVLEASRQVYGLVFVGTNGRGIFYRHTGNIQS